MYTCIKGSDWSCIHVLKDWSCIHVLKESDWSCIHVLKGNDVYMY